MLQKIIAKYSARPFPRNLQALRRCCVSYGQFGEDLFLTSLLGYGNSSGFYVDVGCYRPIEFSNTYIFYQRGWNGLVIDPNPNWRGEWRRFRPRDRFVNTAVSSKAGLANYVSNKQFPACNRLVKDEPLSMSPDESLTTVPTRPLEDILDEFAPKQLIDLLNVDCEGHDLTVLQTLDFDRYSPKVIAAEDSTAALDSPLCSFLAVKNYDCKGYIGLTKVFQINA